MGRVPATTERATKADINRLCGELPQRRLELEEWKALLPGLRFAPGSGGAADAAELFPITAVPLHVDDDSLRRMADDRRRELHPG